MIKTTLSLHADLSMHQRKDCLPATIKCKLEDWRTKQPGQWHKARKPPNAAGPLHSPSPHSSPSGSPTSVFPASQFSTQPVLYQHSDFISWMQRQESVERAAKGWASQNFGWALYPYVSNLAVCAEAEQHPGQEGKRASPSLAFQTWREGKKKKSHHTSKWESSLWNTIFKALSLIPRGLCCSYLPLAIRKK